MKEVTDMYLNRLFTHFLTAFDSGFACVYLFLSKSIPLLIVCYRPSMHRGRMKSTLNAIRQGERGHFVQTMNSWMTTLTSILHARWGEILEKNYRDISGVHCIHRMVFHCFCKLSLWLPLLILLYCESIYDVWIEIELNWIRYTNTGYKILACLLESAGSDYFHSSHTCLMLSYSAYIFSIKVGRHNLLKIYSKYLFQILLTDADQDWRMYKLLHPYFSVGCKFSVHAIISTEV